MAVAEAKLLDAQGGMEYLAGAGGCGIVNADAYIAGAVTDFSEVGVKALDDYSDVAKTFNDAVEGTTDGVALNK